ncbi:hypothetical protein [Bacillus sp. 166amftsu]|uniref:hypothetical protein n=1 Tax=Bacillus sp. 166amftsu TaxID=1761753 RepID=UPI00089ABC35|nr:hypothetical protein [Bacillus sp. 166amftsu]SDY76680.1 hypothetical protein SAMN04488156_102282 [Bacillus sp. 166amftsu]
MKTFDTGLKSNWRAFKEFVENKQKDYLTKYYFVFEECDCGDTSYVFVQHNELDDWLEKMFWTWGRYDTDDLRNSMGNVKVWKLISEADFKKWNPIYKGARKTSIVINDEVYYRKLMKINVEPSVIVSTDIY